MSAPGTTPGPWKVYYTKNGQTVIGIGDRTGGGIVDPEFALWRSGKEQRANARLIAAAPLMFDVLAASAADLTEMNGWSDAQIRGWAYAVARSAQATITKISGEQQ